MRFEALALHGAYRVTAEPYADHRGLFARTFCTREFEEHGLCGVFVQINHSLSRERGTVRGLHFQHPPLCEVKLVRCLRGEAFDVIVDLRRDSRTFLHWHAEHLTPEKMNALYVPAGFAHGFQTLAHDTELLYLHSNFYAPGHEGGIRHDDPLLKVSWPLPVTDLSERDRNHPLLDAGFEGLKP